MARILVVDDMVEIVDFFASVLGGLGHEVIGAHDGESGLKRFRDDLPDLVFLDLLLPKRDGSDVCAEIKRSEHGLITPVVIITGVYKNQSKVEAMKQHGVADYLTKPIPVAKITALVEFLLSGKPEEEATPEEDFELLRLSPLPDEVCPRLENAVVPEILATAVRERHNGVLLAVHGKVRKALLIEEGRIVGVRSNAPADRADRVMLSMRKVTPLQMSALREGTRTHGDPLAAALALGFIDETGRQEVRRYQAMAVGLTLLRWQDGAVTFRPGELMDCPRLDPAIDPMRLALLGVRKSASLREAIARRALRPELVLARPDSHALALRDTDLARRERDALDLIDGRRSVFQLCQVGKLAQLPVEESLSILIGSGLVVPSGDAGDGVVGPLAIAGSGSHLTGMLSEHPFAELVGVLSRERATGMLSVDAQVRRSFVFHEGRIVFARSSGPDDALGQLLVQRGLISASALAEALAVQRDRRPDRRIGALLVEMGALSVTQLETAAHDQLRRIIETTFAWTEGAYTFEPLAQGESGPTLSLEIDLLALLRSGVLQIDPDVLLQRWHRPDREVFLVAVEAAAPDGVLDGIEREVFDRVQEGVSIDSLLRSDPRRIELLRAVQVLIAAGCARAEERERAEVDPATTDVALMPSPAVPEGSQSTTLLPAAPPSDDDLPVVTLIEDDEPEAGTASPGAPGALGPLLQFLREELLADKRTSELEARRLSVEVGRLTERVRALEEENQVLRAAAAAAPARTTAPGDPAADAEAAPAPAKRPRAPRKKKAPELEPVAV